MARVFPSWPSLRRFLLAHRELLRTRRLVRQRPAGSLVEILEATTSPARPEDLPEAHAWAVAVGRAARSSLFRSTCLVRSLALVRLLERAGIRGARLRAGVQRENGRFLAHTWVELGPQVLTDPAWYVARFEPWADLRLFEDLSR